MRFSIRSKFLLVMSGLLIVCLGFYLIMSITVFKTDKTKLVFDLNRSQVSNISSELETSLNGLSETLALFAQIPTESQESIIDTIFSNDTDIVSISIYKKSGQQEPTQQFYRETYFETYGLDSAQRESILRKSQPPFDEILKKGQAIWNASQEFSPPLMAFGKRVVLLDNNKQPLDQWVMVALVRLDGLIKSVSSQGLSEVFITNSSGEVIVQKNAESLAQRPQLGEHPLFSRASQSGVRLSVAKMDIEGKGWLTAFGKAFQGQVFVMALSPEEKVFAVVQSLTVRTLLFGSIVLTLVILAAFLLSRSLTENISLSANRMSLASQGDLTTNLKLQGQDETVLLGNAFNTMIGDLRRSRDELEDMNRELDQKVKDRTLQLEIQNRKVVETQEALIRTTRLASMGEVAGQAAHEVLNPLTSLLTRASLTEKKVTGERSQPIQLLSEITDAWDQDISEGGFEKLAENWKTPSTILEGQNLFQEDLQNIKEIKKSLSQQSIELLKDIKFIRDEGSRISKIIHSMRRMGNMQSESQSLSAHELIGDCLDIMADLFGQQDIELRHEFLAENDRILVDKDEFIQSLTNLMRNSLQSLVEVRLIHRNHQPLFKITTYEEGSELYIEIEDNGIGIESKDQTSLFKSHFTTKSRDEGTGVGLSISRRFIRSHNGDIEFVRSKPLESTLFRIKLPIQSQSDFDKAVA